MVSFDTCSWTLYRSELCPLSLFPSPTKFLFFALHPPNPSPLPPNLSESCRPTALFPTSLLCSPLAYTLTHSVARSLTTLLICCSLALSGACVRARIFFNFFPSMLSVLPSCLPLPSLLFSCRILPPRLSFITQI